MTARRDRAIKRYGTPAYRASLPGQPRPQSPSRYSQVELRERRRRGLTVGHYSGDWSLAREIAEVVGPLAERVADAPRPTRFKLPVNWLAEDTHEAVGVVVGWLAEADARAKTKHLADEPGKRKFAMTKLIDLAERPRLPEVTAQALAYGSWSGQLVALAEGVDAVFSDLLSHAYPPEADGLRGREGRSERLARLLGRTLDRAALELQRRLDSAADKPEPTSTAHNPTERARAELESLGVQL